MNLKNEGNKCFKKSDYMGAIENYTLGLNANRNLKPLWLNRALCYIKIG